VLLISDLTCLVVEEDNITHSIVEWARAADWSQMPCHPVVQDSVCIRAGTGSAFAEFFGAAMSLVRDPSLARGLIVKVTHALAWALPFVHLLPASNRWYSIRRFTLSPAVLQSSDHLVKSFGFTATVAASKHPLRHLGAAVAPAEPVAVSPNSRVWVEAIKQVVAPWYSSLWLNWKAPEGALDLPLALTDLFYFSNTFINVRNNGADAGSVGILASGLDIVQPAEAAEFGIAQPAEAAHAAKLDLGQPAEAAGLNNAQAAEAAEFDGGHFAEAAELRIARPAGAAQLGLAQPAGAAGATELGITQPARAAELDIARQAVQPVEAPELDISQSPGAAELDIAQPAHDADFNDAQPAHTRTILTVPNRPSELGHMYCGCWRGCNTIIDCERTMQNGICDCCVHGGCYGCGGGCDGDDCGLDPPGHNHGTTVAPASGTEQVILSGVLPSLSSVEPRRCLSRRGESVFTQQTLMYSVTFSWVSIPKVFADGFRVFYTTEGRSDPDGFIAESFRLCAILPGDSVPRLTCRCAAGAADIGAVMVADVRAGAVDDGAVARENCLSPHADIAPNIIVCDSQQRVPIVTADGVRHVRNVGCLAELKQQGATAEELEQATVTGIWGFFCSCPHGNVDGRCREIVGGRGRRCLECSNYAGFDIPLAWFQNVLECRCSCVHCWDRDDSSSNSDSEECQRHGWHEPALDITSLRTGGGDAAAAPDGGALGAADSEVSWVLTHFSKHTAGNNTAMMEQMVHEASQVETCLQCNCTRNLCMHGLCVEHCALNECECIEKSAVRWEHWCVSQSCAMVAMEMTYGMESKTVQKFEVWGEAQKCSEKIDQLEMVYHSLFIQPGQIHNVREAKIEEVRRHYTMVVMAESHGEGRADEIVQQVWDQMVVLAQDQQRMWDQLLMIVDLGGFEFDEDIDFLYEGDVDGERHICIWGLAARRPVAEVCETDAPEEVEQQRRKRVAALVVAADGRQLLQVIADDEFELIMVDGGDKDAVLARLAMVMGEESMRNLTEVSYLGMAYGESLETEFYRVGFGDMGGKELVDRGYAWVEDTLVAACLEEGGALRIGQHFLKRDSIRVSLQKR
jgi:hypothetical protein